MTAILRRTASGLRMIVHPCEICGSDNAPFGYRVAGQPSRWYCLADRGVGEAFIGKGVA